MTNSATNPAAQRFNAHLPAPPKAATLAVLDAWDTFVATVPTFSSFERNRAFANWLAENFGWSFQNVHARRD